MLAVHQRREASASSEEPHPQPGLVPALEAPEVVEDAVEVVAGCDVDPEPLLVLTPLVAPPEVAPTELELVPRLPLVPTDLPLDPVPAEAVELAALLEEFNVELVALPELAPAVEVVVPEVEVAAAPPLLEPDDPTVEAPALPELEVALAAPPEEVAPEELLALVDPDDETAPDELPLPEVTLLLAVEMPEPPVEALELLLSWPASGGPASSGAPASAASEIL
jgi:hypothetical protein